MNKKTRIPAKPAENRLYPVLKIVLFLAFLLWSYIALKYYYKSVSFNPFNPAPLKWVLSTRFFTGSMNGIGVFAGHIYRILLVLLFVVSAYGLGRKAWGLLKLGDETDTPGMELPIFQAALGTAGIIFFTLAIGLAGLLYPAVIWVFLLGCAYLGFQGTRPFLKAFKGSSGKKEKLLVLPLAVIILACLVNLVASLVPETFYDSLTYNIGLSQNWINHHRIFSTKFMHTSYYPLNFTVLYTVGVILKDEIVAKLMVFMLGLGMIFGTYAFCKKYFSARVGLAAALIFCTVPIIMNLSWKTTVELGLGFYEFLALFCFINWCNDDKDKWLYLCGFFTGVSIGGKYISFFTAVTIFLLIYIRQLFAAEKPDWLKSVKSSAVYFLIVLAVTSVWFIKNLIIVGNPLYPILWKFTSQLKSADPGPIKYTLSNILLFPWKYTMGQLQQETIIGPVFLMLLPLLFSFFRGVSRNIKLLYVFSLIYIILWVVIGKAYCRFLASAVPALSIITAYYLVNMPLSTAIRNITLNVLAVVLLGNIYYSALIMKSSMDPLGYFLGLQSKTEYLSVNRPSYPNPYYQTVVVLNEKLDKNAGVLVLGECRGFFIERKFVISMANDTNPLITYCRSEASRDPDGLYAEFKKADPHSRAKPGSSKRDPSKTG